MFGETTLRDLANATLAVAEADEAEVVLMATDGALTRFASNHIHQNVAERNLELRVRLVRGTRVGVATTNDTSPAAVRAAVDSAAALADRQPPVADWPGLPRPAPAAMATAAALDEATAATSPEDRADFVAHLCRAAASASVNASGALSTAAEELAVANSHGVWAYHAGSRVSWVAVVLAGSGAGYSEWHGWRLADAAPAVLADEALAKALASREPEALAPGTYPVVLEPYATATLVDFLASPGFSGQAYNEGRSFLRERLGQAVASPAVQIVDDWRYPGQIPLPFDFEGVPRQRVPCLVDGVARGAVWDTRSAARAGDGRQSTGHALPAPHGWGPAPMHLVMAPGDATVAEMVASIERGVYVTRFNYVRTVHPKETIITGLTRDGTFLIEAGRLARPVHNLRFTQSILGALSGTRAVGRDLKAVGEGFATTLAPAVCLDAFEFTGATTF